MAVGTDHLALCDLVEDALPASVRQRLRNLERLIPEVIELENDRVGLAAINAGMGAEVLDEVDGPLERQDALAVARLLHIALPVRQVMLSLVVRSTSSTHVVALPTTFPSPVELGEGLGLAAATAPSGLVRRGLVHTN
jgi:hypothetical protein